MLKKEELQMIRGGAWQGVVAVVCGVITVLIGIVDGYLRPLRCR